MTDNQSKIIQKKDNDSEDKPFEWHGQQQLLLKNWAEVCACYRWLHNQSYALYKKKNFKFMIPIIIISTVTGTANFAQSSFPSSIASFAPAMIGLLNLIAALMTTVYQYMKISELLEAHRQASINFGKLSRNITVELNLPVKDRTNSGADYVKLCRSELDRLIEQSPYIEKNILNLFQSKFGEDDFAKPEITIINRVQIFEDNENKVSNIVASAGNKFSNLLNIAKNKRPTIVKPNLTTAEKSKEDINRELEVLSKSKIVNNSKSIINNLSKNTNSTNLTNQNAKGWTDAINLLKPKIDDIPEIDSDTDTTINNVVINIIPDDIDKK